MKFLLLVTGLLLFSLLSFPQKTEIKYLSGTDKDKTVDWEFRVSGGRNSGEWKTIPVPSNWEMQGFGTYHYWSDWTDKKAPDSIGIYRYSFDAPREWKNKDIKLFFGGVMTDTKVKINGKIAGDVHQGGFYQFNFDVTNLLKFDQKNLLEVTVKRFSDNHSVILAERRADFWMFSGIYRPVWLEIKPKAHINRLSIDAKHEGELYLELFTDGINSSSYYIETKIYDSNGMLIGKPLKINLEQGREKVTINTVVTGISPWTAEDPNLYKLKATLKDGAKSLHEVTEKFGFRTIEVREGDGIYVNNKKIRLRGTNRHSFWPTSGRTTSKELSIMDVNLIKDMNMNAVRMSHYPPDKHFLEVTDSLGLYVINELTGWQDEYDTRVGTKLVKELIIRDVNHPSIILWANGNEGGWNNELDKEFSKWDTQKRNIIHPWDNHGGINTSHYEVFDCCAGTFFHGNDLFMPTEFLHGLYDGGNGAALEDWWNKMIDNPLAVGGFLWAYADEGIVRDDRNGAIDVAGNSAPDGIVGPFREKEGSFFTIKEIWSPVYISKKEQNHLTELFNGVMAVENRYDHTNLNKIDFSWQLIDFPKPGNNIGHDIAYRGTINSPDVEPHQTGKLSLDLPKDWHRHDALYMTAKDQHGRIIYNWTWMISSPDKLAGEIIKTHEPSEVKGYKKDKFIVLESNETKAYIDLQTGMIDHVEKDGFQIPLSNGPVLINGNSELQTITYSEEGDHYVVKASFNGELKSVEWRMLPGGWLKLAYAYHLRSHEEVDYIGVSFSYPEEEVTGLKWLGKGPYRVWKNRTKGVEYDLWYKKYNDTMTGLNWDYPEFKGFHSNVYWATIETKGLPLTMLFKSNDMYLRLFTPKKPSQNGFDPRTTHVDFPEGDISFLKGIAPIGTKFHTAKQLGPAGKPNLIPRHGLYVYEEVLFYFGF
jgi:hypothetical protein